MKGSKDKEFIELRNRFFIGLFIACIIGAVVILLFFQRFTFGIGISSKMMQKQDFVIYIDSYDCGDSCDKVKKLLDQKNVKYESLKIDSQEADNLLEKYKITNTVEVVPAVIYIKDGKVYSSMFEVTNLEELELFLKNYQLSK
ncbi:MAG: hypothetical protein IJ193_03365 [Bacilli bacterium]|nr:hypothetical protein [Bacilli bacterium]